MNNIEKGKIKLGIISAGRFAVRRFLPQIVKLPHFELVALHNRTLSKAEDLAQKYSIPKYTHIEKELLNMNLDALLICSPNYLHQKHILEALEKGFHVFVEKPMTTSKESATEVIEALTENQLVMVGHCYRFKNAVQKAKDYLQRDLLGKVLSVDMTMHMALPFNGWRFEKRYGGGAILELGVHLVDTIRFLFEKEFQSVYALATHHTDSQGEPVDVAFQALGELQGDLPVSFRGAFNSPYETHFSIKGSKGILESTYVLRGDSDGKESLTFRDLNEECTPIELETSDIYFQELQHFQNVILGKKNLLTVQNALENIKVLDAIRKSIETKQREKLNFSLPSTIPSLI